MITVDLESKWKLRHFGCLLISSERRNHLLICFQVNVLTHCTEVKLSEWQCEVIQKNKEMDISESPGLDTTRETQLEKKTESIIIKDHPVKEQNINEVCNLHLFRVWAYTYMAYASTHAPTRWGQACTCVSPGVNKQILKWSLVFADDIMLASLFRTNLASWIQD